MFTPDPGGRQPTRGEVRRSLTAGSSWSQRRDLPDPCGWADFAAFPELFFVQLRRRIASGRYPISGERFTLPKPGVPGGLRILTWLDPYDEVVMRVLVGRLLPSIEAHRRGEVYSYRLGANPPGWWTERHGPAIVARRERGLALLADPTCVGLGTFDVRDYYRSVKPEVASTVLVDLGCPVGAVAAFTMTLRRLGELGAPGGLPIGFEGSGVVGNAMLYPLDAMLRPVVPFVRYTDDVWVFPAGAAAWGDLVTRTSAVLASLNLELNNTKVGLWTPPLDDPEGIIRNRTLDSVTAAAGDSGTVSAETALELLDNHLVSEDTDWAVVRFALGVLGTTRDVRGVDLLEKYSHAFAEEPAAVGRYLTILADHARTSRRLDREWLVERAADGSGRELAARLHACVVASHLHLGKATGRRFFDLATAIADQRRAPLQVWAATAWGASEDWKPARAVDAAEHFGNLQLRRAFCLSFPGRGGAGRQGRKWKAHLTLKEPDLRPTAEYAFR